jgi:diguanylate cyclase (GGDEF)-like protein
MLFNQSTSLVVGGVALSAVACISWLRTGHSWFLVWTAVALIALVGRLGLERAFRARRHAIVDLAKWRARFIAGAWIMGALWGVGALTIVDHRDPLVEMFVISVEIIIVMGAAARNASCLPAARGQTVLALSPMFVACLATNDPFYRAFSIVFLFAGFAARTLYRHLYHQRVRFLRMNEALADANQRLERAATTDSLTGIANRRRFDAALAEEVRGAKREHCELALLLIDIDVFKGFNDLYGHQAGDECLQRVAAAFEAAFRRPGDLVARYGGEEFAAILPRTDLEAAAGLAEIVRGDIESLALRNPGSPRGFVSVSVGVASLPGSLRAEDLLRAADEALYAAKAAGRNCVRVKPGGTGTRGALCTPDSA